MNIFALILIVFIASILQTATGFGFAIMAVPCLLAVFEPHDAIELNIILSFLIAFFLNLKIYDRVDRETLKRLIIGSLFGIPPGLLIFLYLDVRLLKVLVSILILSSTCLLVAKVKFQQSKIKELIVGVFSGLLTTSIGMPGPPLMIYYAGNEVDKETLRSTTIAYCVFVNIISFFLQFFFYHTSKIVWVSTLWSIPFMLLGVFLGQLIFVRLNQDFLKRIVINVLLFITGIYLLITTIY
ncbi:sulfite exporter TauE/SafE family protein [Desulfoscipio sp. XC116]|uniref:sulfite exporter TauE/SafE family protein n=1 Tax=Desulfoscipio sp. XC116 TaxID=3144975 RepID=UPI00325BEC0B